MNWIYIKKFLFIEYISMSLSANISKIFIFKEYKIFKDKVDNQFTNPIWSLPNWIIEKLFSFTWNVQSNKLRECLL